MTTMKDLQKKNDADLVKFIALKREELRELRFKGAGSGMRDTKSINNAKKELARALTEQHARVKQA